MKSTTKKRKVTAQQCAAIGYDLTKEEVPNAHEIYVQSEGEPLLDGAGNLTFDARLIAPDGRDLVAGSKLTVIPSAKKKHKVTAAQCKSVGLELGVAEKSKPHETFTRIKGEPILDDAGNLTFNGKLYSPLGKNITGLGITQTEKFEEAAAKGTPAQQKEGREELNEYEKVLERVREFKAMTDLPAWSRLFARVVAMRTQSSIDLENPEVCKSTAHMSYFQARIQATKESMNIIQQACNALNRFSTDDELPGLWTERTPATAQFNEETGRVSIIGGEPISKAVKKALKSGAKDEGTTGPPVEVPTAKKEAASATG